MECVRTLLGAGADVSRAKVGFPVVEVESGKYVSANTHSTGIMRRMTVHITTGQVEGAFGLVGEASCMRHTTTVF